MSIIILDTETTDKDPNNRLVQLAYKNLTTDEVVNEYFKPPVPITFGAMAVHHITSKMVEDKQPFADSQHRADLIELLKNNILVAHNAPFDIQVLKNEGVAIGQSLDTLRIARHLLDSEQYSLQYLRYFLDLNIEADAHDALGDILVLEKLFVYLQNHVKAKFNYSSEEEILNKLLELNAQPVLLDVINFGKYRGKTFAEIAKTDKSYLQWLFGSETEKAGADQNEELVYTLKHYL
ncbi:MAG TPA: DNA polymerase III subunit epsilon [Candidatus Magasanikbacteria bacterium]|nr:DNA polymerase III subunit epsilon [Candidatus Magasanikbacteria bacterium]